MQSPERDLQLMELHVAALFVHDENGRMVRVNVAQQIDAPRFFLGRTPAGIIVRFRTDLRDEIVERLKALAAGEPPDLATKDPVHAAEYLKILEAHSPLRGIFHEQAFSFPDDLEAVHAEDVVKITQGNADLLRGGFEDWLADIAAAQPFIAVVRDGRAVSLSASVRITPHAHECGIETLVDYRCRGLAGRATISWAMEARDLGITPLYSTMWNNTASQRVAARIGCRQFGSDFYVA